MNRECAGSTARIPDERMWKDTHGPLGVLRACLLCMFHTTVRKGIPGVGRGYGMRMGNKARGEMTQHFKTAHAAQYKALKVAAEAAQSKRKQS